MEYIEKENLYAIYACVVDAQITVLECNTRAVCIIV